MTISPEHARILLRTDTRGAFIRLFETIGLGIDKRFLHQKANPLFMSFSGDRKSAKSLGVEVLMKTLSDGHTLDKTLTDEEPYMFLETEPCQAIDTVKGIFNVAGLPVLMIFNSDRPTRQFIKEANNLIVFNRAVSGGALFTSYSYAPAPPSEAWLSVEITAVGDDWRRSIILTVQNEALWRSPQFQLAWHALSEQSASKNPNHTFNDLIL